MKIAYLVLAHNNPHHLACLVRALASDSNDVFIHIDRKADIEVFAAICGDGVDFIDDRVAVYWGDYSIVDATMAVIKAALAKAKNYDYMILLSGTDYPMRSNSHIENYLAANHGGEFMNIVAMPSTQLSKPLSRLTEFHRRPGLYGHAAAFTRRVMVKLKIVPYERDYKSRLGTLKPYAGSAWWALTREACCYIQDFVTRNPHIVDFYKNTVFPDEMIFQTILGNSPFKQKLRHNMTYTDWSEGGPHPAAIVGRHIEKFRASATITVDDDYGAGELLFARKVTDPAVSDQLESYLKSVSSEP